MRLTTRLAGFLLMASLIGSASCSRQAETAAADETADQMIEAANEGRSAARKIVARNWTDTMELQNAVLEARAVSSKYDIEKQRKCREAFDTAFFNTIRVVRPDLAREIAGEDEAR